MSNRRVGLMMAAAVLVAVVLVEPVPVAGQASAAAAKTWNPPRTPDGQADMQGYWHHRAVGMATYSLEGEGNESHLVLSAGCAQGVVGCERSAAELASAAAARRTAPGSVIVDPPNGKVPYQPWAAAKRKDISDNHTNPKPKHVDPQARCFLTGVPRITYQEYEVFQITQTPEKVVISYEFEHIYRIIPLDKRPPLGEDVKLWMGNSRGHWEGNTLVVDVTNHNDKTWFDIVGTFHSDALRVVERWTLVDADTIHYEATIEDPKVFTRPWKMAFAIERQKANGYELVEMACREGNERNETLMLRRK